MTQHEGIGTLLDAGIPRTLSDRPFAVRAGVHVGRFIRTKPLGAFGGFLVLVLFLVAIFAEKIDRVGPHEIIRVAVSDCAPDEVENLDVECFSPELLAQSRTDVTIKLRYPPSRFQAGTGEGAILIRASSSSEHWFGTDGRGRDVWSRVVHGSRLAIQVGIGGALIALLGGTTFGMISAYFGRWVDFSMQRFTDAFLAFPPLILLLVFVQVIENPNTWWTTLALGILGIASVTRVARSAVLTARAEVYVMAARTVGASDLRIMLRHILPNIVAPLVVVFTISIGLYILAEAGLAFIGLSDPTAISWGAMVNEGRQLGPAAPMMALYVGLAISFTVLGFNLLGDALRDVLDPRLRGSGGGRPSL